MADIFSEAQRSYNMSRIRSKNTKPEIAVRSMLHRLGYRFTVNGPKNKKLPGKPDIVLPKYKTVIFVHGCFWHGHAGCKDFRYPKTRTEWWKAKIDGNVARDQKRIAELEAMGWRVLVIWGCELKNASAEKKLSILS
ncbi:DNA mismatch endonuclease Vsr [Coraliomargarita sp. SDUM461004]|uniref:Very short patch repair endonuclease n=1 Tax=Thalassobacterium sedimentorum TaxID=3041258 RepID=A0ABU1ANA0_9BACT|nr:DNA mismatch endonuclease Vsr [Coraliomargarita sp. SDUM461004]MDQ8196280.1 DNA mismatch endonuclease Vsr [Coraliomargarita sp. SDUM461004]